MSRGDAGETLLELLLSTVILGLAVSALLFGFGAAATTGGFHAKQAGQAQLLANAVEVVQAAPYADCASTYSATAPSGYFVTVAVEAWASGTGFATTCGADGGAQRVRVVVGQSDNRVRGEEIVVVKRKPCASLPC